MCGTVTATTKEKYQTWRKNWSINTNFILSAWKSVCNRTKIWSYTVQCKSCQDEAQI